MMVTRIPLENIAPHLVLLPPSPNPQPTFRAPWPTALLRGPLVATRPDPLLPQQDLQDVV